MKVICFSLFKERIPRLWIASDIDQKYFDEIKKAKEKGVKIIAYSCKVKDNEITVNKSIKVII